MAGGVIIDGVKTVFPGTYVSTTFSKARALPAGAGNMALVGSFPFLERGVAYLSTTKAAFERLSPRDADQLLLSDILWNPSNDGRTPGRPAGVYLFSVDTTTQAQAYLQDATPANAVLLKSKIWGTRGTLTVATLAATTIGGKSYVTFTAANNGVTYDNFKVAADDNVVTLTYANPYTADGTVAKGFTGTTGLGSGGSGWVKATKSGDDLTLTFSTSVPEGAIDDTGAVNTWIPGGPINSALAMIAGASAALGGGATHLMVEMTGTVNGAVVVERLRIAAADIATPAAATSTTVWGSSDLVVKCYPVNATGTAGIPGTAGTPSGSYGGDVFTFSGTNLTMNETAGQKYCSDVITRVSMFADYGFTASTGSTKSATTLTASLDDKAATTIVGGLALGATAYRLVEAINKNSVLVTAEQVLQTAVDLSADLTVPLEGGALTAAGVADDYTEVYETASWYDIIAISPYTDDSAIHAVHKAHVRYMSGVGANERIGVVGATAAETLNELLARAVALDDLNVLIPDQADRVTYNGTTVTLEPYQYAALVAAWAAGNLQTPLTNKNPGVVAFYRDASISTREGQEAAIAGGVCVSVQPPGRLPLLPRFVTCYTTDEDPARTEASAVLSRMRMARFIRDTCATFIGSNTTTTTGASLKVAIAQALDQLVASGVIQAWQPETLQLTQYSDRWQVTFKFTPSYPFNFAVVEPVIDVPLA